MQKVFCFEKNFQLETRNYIDFSRKLLDLMHEPAESSIGLQLDFRFQQVIGFGFKIGVNFSLEREMTL